MSSIFFYYYHESRRTELEMHMDGIAYHVNKGEILEEKIMDFSGIQTNNIFGKTVEIRGKLSVDGKYREILVEIEEDKLNVFEWFGGIQGFVGGEFDYVILYFDGKKYRNADAQIADDDTIVWVFAKEGNLQAEKIAQELHK